MHETRPAIAARLRKTEAKYDDDGEWDDEDAAWDGVEDAEGDAVSNESTPTLSSTNASFSAKRAYDEVESGDEEQYEEEDLTTSPGAPTFMT